jgi:hypothetical protein
MRKFSVILLAVIVVLGAGLLVIACEGSFVDPAVIEEGGINEDGGGGGNGGGGDNGGDNGRGGKPAKLKYDATLDEAIAKMDEIISYSGTSSSIKASARQMKDMLERMDSASWWINDNYLGLIDSINALIELI